MTGHFRSYLSKLVPLLILVAATIATLGLIRSRPEVEVSTPVPIPPLVRVTTAQPTAVRLDVEAQGTVLPRTETVLVTRVAGTVTRAASTFENGGFIAKGQVLVELDRRDHELAVRRAEANVAQAELQLVLEEAEAEVARAEWHRLGESGEPGPLVLRRPQVARATAALEAARADLEKSQLDLERTKIRAPFDGRIRQKRADVGQFLTPGSPLATLHATDYSEVRLPVADQQLAFLDLPFLFRSQAGQPGPTVRLEADFAGSRHFWSGSLVRTEGELDPRTRMINLVARVEKPYEQDPSLDRPPLSVGLFVTATIEGRIIENAFSLPRDALRNDQEVLIVDHENRLRPRRVELIRSERDVVIVAAGLEAGELVCISPLDIVTDGMEVRVVNTDQRSSGAIETTFTEEQS